MKGVSKTMNQADSGHKSMPQSFSTNKEIRSSNLVWEHTWHNKWTPDHGDGSIVIITGRRGYSPRGIAFTIKRMNITFINTGVRNLVLKQGSEATRVKSSRAMYPHLLNNTQSTSGNMLLGVVYHHVENSFKHKYGSERGSFGTCRKDDLWWRH